MSDISIEEAFTSKIEVLDRLISNRIDMQLEELAGITDENIAVYETVWKANQMMNVRAVDMEDTPISCNDIFNGIKQEIKNLQKARLCLLKARHKYTTYENKDEMLQYIVVMSITEMLLYKLDINVFNLLEDILDMLDVDNISR